MASDPNDIIWDDEPQPETPAAAPTAAPAAQAPAEAPHPDDIIWDDAPTHETAPKAAPKADDAPAPDVVVIGHRNSAPKTQVVDNSYTAKGFDVQSDYHPHSALTPDELHEYAAMFDPKNPPSAAKLQTWYKDKTGADLSNAQQIIDIWHKTGKLNLHEKISVPVHHQSGPAAGLDHVANSLAADYGSEAAAGLSTVGEAASRVFGNGEDGSLGNYWANQADINHAQLEQDTTDHPYWSAGGELTGAILTIPVGGEVSDAVGLSKLGRAGSNAIRGTAEGAAYGSGNAGPGNRMEGAAGGAALGAVASLTGDTALGGMARQSAQDAAKGREVLDAAQALNDQYGTKITPVAGNVGGMLSRSATSGSESTVLGSVLLGRAGDKMLTETGNAVKGMTGGKALSEVGEDLTRTGNPNSLINLPNRLKQRYDAFYDRAGKLAGNIKLATPKTIAALDEQIARLEQTPGGVAGLDKLKDLRKALTNGGTVDGLRILRTSFGDSLESGNRTVRDASKRLWGPLSDDISEGLTAAGKNDAANAYRRADTSFRNSMGHIDAVNGLLEGKSGQQVADALSSMARRDDKGLQDILRLASPDETRGIQAGIIENLGKGKDGFSLRSFLTNYNKLTDTAKARVFNGQLRTDLTNLAKIAEGAARGHTFANTSRTGLAFSWQNVFRALDAAHVYATAGKTAALSGGIGYLLSAPWFARALVRWGETGATRDQIIQQMSHLATRMAGRQGAPAAEAFLHALKHDGAAPAATRPPPHRPTSSPTASTTSTRMRSSRRTTKRRTTLPRRKTTAQKNTFDENANTTDN
jgi:hypothetical protein